MKVKQPGNVGLGTIDFPLHQKTLTCKSEKAKLAHDQVLEECKPDILGTKDPRWNKSTFVDGRKFSKQQAENKLSIDPGPPFRDPDILWSRPALPGPWNAATEINRKVLQKTLENSMKGDHRNTMKRSAHLSGYLDPTASQSPDVRRTRSLSPAKRTCHCPDPVGFEDFSPRWSKRKNRPPRQKDLDEVRALDTWQPPLKLKASDAEASTNPTEAKADGKADTGLCPPT